ncbi:MAG: flavin-nucleotide-binding protein, partial [Burkholderiaceae bacterium]
MQNLEMQTPNQSETPFHAGERAVHQRLGIAEKLDERGRQVIRDHMPDQHRDFFAQLPFLIVGSTDQTGQPWASVLVGQPGFISSPHARQLDV